jgi:hypothetical protein
LVRLTCSPKLPDSAHSRKYMLVQCTSGRSGELSPSLTFLDSFRRSEPRVEKRISQTFLSLDVCLRPANSRSNAAHANGQATLSGFTSRAILLPAFCSAMRKS